jgi:alkaline phosphatase
MKKIYLLILCSFLNLHFSIAQEYKPFKLHSHNDYLRKVPFWEAFGAGCASIEADVILQDGELMVAHEKATIRKERTLKSLYLSPIQKAKELGLVDEFNFHLLIDFKTEAYTTLDALIQDLREFESMLYSSSNPNGLKIIVSGNRPKVEDYPKYPSWIFFDYQSKVMDDELPWDKIGMVSLNFRQFSVWNGKGRIVEQEKEKLVSFIQQVHGFGKPVRFWATPDSKSAWKSFYDLRIDYINTDMPYEANQYLSNLDKNIFVGDNSYEPYVPTFAKDGANTKIENIILMIGDGNGLAQISAGMFVNNNQLNLTQIKNIGLVKTQAADDFTTDSAAGATAYATGRKANNRALGIGPEGEISENIPDLIRNYGFNSGIITTDQLTGATPASFYAHHPERDDIHQIAGYLSKSNLNLFIGGGRRDFTQFGENRILELETNGFQIMTSLDEIGNTNNEKVGYFASASGMPTLEKGRGEFLLKSSKNAIRFFETKKAPFFLMIESAMIDSGGHANSSATIVTELLDFDQVIGWMLEYVDKNPNTLLLVTADHETAGLSLPQGDIRNHKIEMAFHSDDHTGIMVPIFAYGAHSGEFRGVYENTEVFHKIMELVSKYY